MIEYFSEKGIASEHAFVPSRPPPARRSSQHSDLPSYYGEQQHDSEATLQPAGSSPTNPFDSVGDDLPPRPRKRNWTAIIMTLIIIGCSAVIIGLAVARSQEQDSHAAPAADTPTASPQSVPASILTEIAEGPEIVTKYTSLASFPEATSMKVFQTTTPDVSQPTSTSVFGESATSVVIATSTLMQTLLTTAGTTTTRDMGA
ncbi:hypothetical protein LTR37_009563 [Vermiconidia calcicola]|uniref:Uncharacterized protein n=1 Tax=Vermiconidia calcicola TaxID=1690605 RepID=A0ACC3N7P0_9PEZI|nr:hypothetical protein LTR37_009563 [Vermiconidia calcicola]